MNVKCMLMNLGVHVCAHITSVTLYSASCPFYTDDGLLKFALNKQWTWVYYRSLSATSSSVSGDRHYSSAATGTGSYDVGTGRSGVGEYCISEWFNASCAGWQRRVPGEGSGDDVTTSVVVMTTALYGRMRSGRCIQMKYGQAGCRTDVLGQLDDECSGRPSCRFQVSSLLASVATPCDGELTPYLEASYTCVRGE